MTPSTARRWIANPKFCRWAALAAFALGCGLSTRAQEGGLGVTTGSSSPTAQDPNQAKPHTVHGTVVNSVTGEPIYRALVQLGGQSAVLTDHQGQFDFDGVSDSLPAWAMKPGYFSQNGSRQYSHPSTEGITESSDTPVVVKLVPEAVISGTVTGDDGAPLEGIPVQLKTLTINDGLNRWVQRQGTTTNSEGQYRFYELQAGKYAVATGFHTEGLADSRASIAYVPVRYPPAVAAAGTAPAAESILLAAGDHRQVDLSPPVERLYPVTGTVVGYGEGRAVSFRVETASGEEIAPSSHFIAATGEFRLLLPGGSYTVTATVYQQPGARSGQRLGWLQARREVNVPQGPVGGISFALEPSATIPVEVAVEAASRPSQDTGQSQRTPEPNIILMNTDPSAPMGFLNAQSDRGGRSDDSSGGGPPGPLTIENVTPGRYVMQAVVGQPWYVSSASCGGVDLMRDELAIGGGAAGCGIRIVLRNDSGSVHVTVREPAASTQTPGSSSQSFIVYLLPLGDLSRQIMPGAAGSNGFSVEGVAPGRYLVLAMDHPQELAYRDPEALRRYGALGQEVSVTANSTADVEVSVATGDL